MHPLRESHERRTTLGVEQDDLSVEYRVGDPPLRQRRAERLQLWVRLGDLGARSRVQPDIPLAGDGERPHTVPLELVRPARTERQLAGRGKHRTWDPRHGPTLAAQSFLID